LSSLSLAALAALSLPAFSQTPAETRPNIVVLIADDLGWRDIGVYGNAVIRTPHLDRLARSGLLVTRVFGTTPQCSPSRISILTGKYAHATGTEDLHTPLPDGERILPSHLQAQGYFTGMMAKTHLGLNGERQFQWYSANLSEALPQFLDSAGTRPFFLWVGLMILTGPTSGVRCRPPTPRLASSFHRIWQTLRRRGPTWRSIMTR
jgi:hypothetical protein